MANVKSIFGEPIVVGTDGIEDGAVTDDKLSTTGVLKKTDRLLGGVLQGDGPGTGVTAHDAHAAPLLCLTVSGRSVQSGTPTPNSPVSIVSVDGVEVHASADGGATDATGWPVTIDLQGNELRSLPDGTHDELTVDRLGRVKLLKRVGARTYDGHGSGYWVTGVQTFGQNVRCNLSAGGWPSVTGAARLNMYCDRLEVSTGPVSDASSNPYTIEMYSTYMMMVIPASALSAATVDGANAWLAANPVTVTYPLTTPETIALGTVDMPDTPAPDLTAWVVTNLETETAITYERDLNLALEGVAERRGQAGYIDHYAIVSNPSGVDYEGKPVQIKVAFERGECPDESHLKVFKDGVEVPSQFEGCRENNYLLSHDRTYWPDGSLRCGTLWVTGSLDADDTETYVVRAYDASVSRSYAKTVTVDGGALWKDITVTDSSGNEYWFRGGKATQTKRLYKKNDDTAFLDDSTYNTSDGRKYVRNIGAKEIRVEGDGVVFVDVVYVYETSDFEWTQVHRVVDGSLIVSTHVKTLDTVTDWGLRDMKNTLSLGSGVTLQSSIGENFQAYRYGDNMASVIYANGNIPRSDTTPPSIPSFPPLVETDNNKLTAGWGSSSTHWDVPEGFVFSFCIHVSFDCDANEHLRQFNPLCTFATRVAPEVLRARIAERLIPHMADVSNAIQAKGLSASGMNQWGKYYRYKWQRIITLSNAVGLFNTNVVQARNLSDPESFVTAWNNWGMEFMGRVMPLAYEYYKDCKDAGDTANRDAFKTLCINCGKAMALILDEYGDIPLTAGVPTSARNNARTSALHLMAIACVLAPNDTDLAASYQQLGQIIIDHSDLNTMLPEGNLSKSRYTHYMAFALFDWVMANKLVPVENNDGFTNWDNFVMDTTEPSGQIKEQEYNPSTARRAFAHTYAYYAGSLILLGGYSGVALAERLVEHLIDNSLPDGEFVYPMDHFDGRFLGQSTISSIIFELAAFIEVMNVWGF